MKTFLSVLVLFMATTAFAAEPILVAPGVAVTVVTHENPKTEDTIDFVSKGKVLQTEASLGDHFVPLEFHGSRSPVQALDLFHDGGKVIFVRLLMVPMGVVRVFRWDAAKAKFQRLEFGKKKEDGLPVPPTALVRLLDNGNLEYIGGPKGHLRRFVLEWNGHDYVLPARSP